MNGAIMSGKRRDSKHRILRDGESQHKDGGYAFKFVVLNGQVQFDDAQAELLRVAEA